MRKNIPFKKEVTFKTNISEILSIALEKDLKLEKNAIKGNIKVYGEYSNYEEKLPFDIDIPYSNYLDECYIIDDATVDINDFYYEIVDNNKLSINIEISLDNLREAPLILEDDESDIKEEVSLVDREEDINDVFTSSLSETNSYMTYRVYIVRENDTIESITEKYKITKEELAKYNILNNINIGDKLIIPNEKNK